MNLKDALKDTLSDEELNILVRSYDLIGDMAIIIIPPELESRESVIGDAVLKIHKHVKVVAKRDGFYEGEFRTIPLKVIAGENRKETEYKEHGVRFYLNPEKVYFSVRLGNERKRLASLVKQGETVLVMFSGIGVFPLVIAKLSPAAEIVGIEKNQAAHAYGLKNLSANKKIKNVRLFDGDVMDILPTLGRKFDRIAMPSPKTADLYLDIALASLKSGGWLHFYEFQKLDHFEDSLLKVTDACSRNNRTLLHNQTVICGHSGPATYRICVDAEIG